jgi:CO dehydrogenase/acetyl-CoA synthase beta subunit
MGLFDQPLADVRRWLDGQQSDGETCQLSSVAPLPWASRPPVVLGDVIAFELGNPAVPSCSMALWGDSDAVVDGQITLVGPDFADVGQPLVPLAQVVIVAGEVEDPIECSRQLREAVYGLRLQGLSTRHHPGTQRVWYRAGQEALSHGFDAAMLGSALLERCRELSFVERAEVLLVTASRQVVTGLLPTAELAADIGAALTQMTEEMSFDCDTCDYTELCDQVDELKTLRDKLRRKERP